MARTIEVEADALEVRTLDAATWPLFDALVERHNGIFGGCWCTWFHPEDGERGAGYEGNRALKRMLVEAGRAHAALLVDAGEDGPEAVAWAEWGPVSELTNIHHRKQYDAEADLVPDWRITCVFVDKRYRRQGLGERAILAAVDQIAAAGGGVVEGYPHERPTKKTSSSFLYNTTRPTYERCGFAFVRSKGLKNTVMRREVAPA